MKNLLLFGALALCLNSFAQITFSQILSFEGKTSNEVQGFLLKNYSLISQTEKVYSYEQMQQFDDSPQYLEDNCTWYGGQIIETLRRVLSH